MNCDRIAPFYKYLEQAAFGNRLQKHRTAFIRDAADKRCALVLGDGDGRFAEALAMAYPNLEIHVIESSAGMVAAAAQRLNRHGNLQIFQQDVFEVRLAVNSYDIVFTHFFLDCFSNQELNDLVGRVSPALTSDALWIVSEFRQAASGWRKLYTRLWLSGMYRFFQITTGLIIAQLPSYPDALQIAGFHLNQQTLSSSGLIVSERWQR
jgi:ubiquinone/menaquinone biosynthesis C-methylase UbiE